MPPLPWTRISTVAPDTECVVMASRLPLRSHLAIPRFLRWTLRIRRQLARAPGLVGYSLDAHLLGKNFWTVSAWTDRAALEHFERADPHHTATRAIRPKMLPTTFVFWTARAGDLPIPWDEVRRRIDEAAPGAVRRALRALARGRRRAGGQRLVRGALSTAPRER